MYIPKNSSLKREGLPIDMKVKFKIEDTTYEESELRLIKCQLGMATILIIGILGWLGAIFVRNGMTAVTVISPNQSKPPFCKFVYVKLD